VSTTSVERALSEHRRRWGEPTLVVRAPGRVNLIGEHTDYNDGFTMPMALPFDTVIALSDHDDRRGGQIEIVSDGFGEVMIEPSADPRQTVAWARHLAGVTSLLADHGVQTGGWRGSIATDIPTGASLSSSAAIEVAAITALLHRAGLAWAPIEVARLGQRVENEVVGLPSGIMDQFISAGAVEGHASLMDCRALTLDPRPLPDAAVVAVMDTGTRRVLAEVAYGERRASCERAAAELGIVKLRDATLDQVATIIDPIDRRRAHHVVSENARTLEAAAVLAAGDVRRFGELMNASHASLRDDFEVSGAGLDAIVQVATASPGCLGARMTGGGFAGCAVALVDADQVEAFCHSVTDRYDYDGHTAKVWICRPAGGASVITQA
jgi:galactokinase